MTKTKASLWRRFPACILSQFRLALRKRSGTSICAKMELTWPRFKGTIIKVDSPTKRRYSNFSRVKTHLGLESAVTMHALMNLQVGDVVDVFCSNVDIEFRADYNSAKFTGFLVHQQH